MTPTKSGFLTFDVELSLTNNEESEKSALVILESVKPDWKKEEITFEYHSDGITNKTFSAKFDKEQVIFKIYGENSDKFIDRADEIKVWKKLAAYDLAAPLYGQFKNGLVYGFLKGDPLKIEQMRSPEFYREIARSMAHFHKTAPNDDADAKPVLLQKMRSFDSVLNRKSDGENERPIPDIFPTNFENDIAQLESIINPMNEQVAFCHNDLLLHNIIYDHENGAIGFIDYEYASSNYVIYEVANHFCEYAGLSAEPDYTLCLKKDQRMEFVKEYLGETVQTEDGKKRVIEMTKNMPLFEAASHLFWTIWALAQFQNSTKDFDYLKYATERYHQFHNRLQRYLDCRKK